MKIKITYIVDSDDNQEDQHFILYEPIIKELIMKQHGYDNINILNIEKIN